MGKRRITIKGLLRLINDTGEIMMPATRKKAFGYFYNLPDKEWDEYFPYSIETIANKLVRKGWVEIKETQKGKLVIITENGKKQVFLLNLDNIKPKFGSWDGRWRIIFFDIEESQRRKRDELRMFLKQLGLRQIQQSVWVSPYEVRDEIKYLREILGVANEVKWGILSEIENEDDLKKWFNIRE